MSAALLRISNAQGVPIGVGFLVTEDIAFTCAHVVAAALGLPEGAHPRAGAEVTVDLPLAPAPGSVGATAFGTSTAPGPISPPRTKARNEYGAPMWESGAADVAVLRLMSPLPGARPTRLVEAAEPWGHTARAFGFPVGRPDGVWHSGVLRDRQARGWLQADLAPSGGYRVTTGFSGSPVWDDELGGVVGMITVAEAGEPAASYLIPVSTLLAAQPGLRALTRPPSPFRGLAAFREADADRFHGRSAESRELAAQVTSQRWTCLVGPSGSGKSSLAWAGAVPLLRQGFAVAVLRPASGSGPTAALASALLRLLEPDLSETARLPMLPQIVDLLASEHLPDVIARAMERQDRDRLLIIVDQMEEAFGLARDDIERLAALLFGDRLPEPVHVLATLRADFLEAALAHPVTGPTLRHGLYALGPLGPGQLREIVTAPVDAVTGVSYEAGLVERILTDTGDAPGALPLLGFTLDQLWQKQTGGLLTHRAYDDLDGVSGALGHHADEVWCTQVPAADEAAARQMLTALVRVPLGSTAATRRIALRTELDDAQWRIVQRLATKDTRLLVTGRSPEGTETAELAHEALIGSWPQLAEQVTEDRAFLVWHETLRHDVHRWERGQRSPDLLPGPAALAAAKPWLRERPADLTATERAYLDEGHAHQHARARKRRALLFGGSFVTVLLLVFGALFGYYRYVSDQRAAESASRALAEYSADQADGDPVRSAQLALAAYRMSPTREARDALLRAYLAENFSDRVLTGPQDAPIGVPDFTHLVNGDAGAVQTSLDGDVVVANSAGGRATVFVHATSGHIRSQRMDVGVQAAYPLVSGDGRRAGFLTLDGGLVWYDVHREGADGELLGPVHRLAALPDAKGKKGEYDGYQAVMSVDGRFATAVDNGELLWWDLDASGTAAHSGRVTVPDDVPDGIRFASGGRTVLIADERFDKGDDHQVVLGIDRITGKSRTVVDGKDIKGVKISGDGTAVAVCAEHEDPKTFTYRITVWRQPVADGPSAARPPGFSEEDNQCDAVESTDTTGRYAQIKEDGWNNLIDLEHHTIAASVGQPLDLGQLSPYPLLGTVDGQPALIGVGNNRVVYSRLGAANRIIPAGMWALTDNGTVVAVFGDGSLIGLVPAGSSRPKVKASRPKPYWKPHDNDLIVFDHGEKHLAERVAADRVMIRTAATLKPVREITTAPLPDNKGDISYFFERSGDLITISGTVIQRWDTATGRQRARYDAKHLGSDHADGALELMVTSYPRPGRVAVTIWGKKAVNIVNLATGRTERTLDTGPDTNTVAFTTDGRYFVLLRRGGAVELWRSDSLKKVMGPVGLGENSARFAVGMPDKDTFMLASHGQIHRYRFGDPAREQDTYSLGTSPPGYQPFTFQAVSGDGRTVLYTDGYGRSAPLRLDPAVWQRALCAIIGDRELPAGTQEALPVKVPHGSLCPRPGTAQPNPGRPEVMDGRQLL